MRVSSASKPSKTAKNLATNRSAWGNSILSPSNAAADSTVRYEPSRTKFAAGRSRRLLSTLENATMNRPIMNSTSASPPNNPSAMSALAGMTPATSNRPNPRQNKIAPVISSASNTTMKLVTKYFSNDTRALCAGKKPASFDSNKVEPLFVRESSSISSFSAASRASSRIWNQLTKAMSLPSPKNATATCPANDPEKAATAKTAMPNINNVK